jgi:tetratricopeptide (TPR) repeat protein
MKIKIRHGLLSLFILLYAILPCIDLYSQDSIQKPSRQAAMDAFSKADYETALREFSTLLQYYSRDPLYKYYSGVCMVKMSRYPGDALAYLQDAINGSLNIKSIPDDVWFYLGRSQQMTGRFPDAIKSYEYFLDKAGRKLARNYRVDTYIKECNEGRGRLKESEYQKVVVAAKTTSDNISTEKIAVTATSTVPSSEKPAVQKKDLPLEYDLVLSEAMNYQVKADSLNALISDHKDAAEKLPPSQKDAAKLKIAEMELLAAQYQKSADDKFSNAGVQPVVKKEVLTIQPSPAQSESKAGKEIFSLFNVQTNPALTGQHGISIDPELPAGLIYRIQIGVFSKQLDPSFFKGISPVAGFKVQGTNSTKYFAGMFRKMTDANRALLTVKQTGFKDSFITAIFDGKAVSIDRASILENEWGQKPLVVINTQQKAEETGPPTLNFRVEISRSDLPLSDEVTGIYKKMAGNRGFEILLTEDGTLVYLIGKFITFESASEYADLLKRNGYQKSKVAAYLGSKEIPVETAKQLFEKQK